MRTAALGLLGLTLGACGGDGGAGTDNNTDGESIIAPGDLGTVISEEAPGKRSEIRTAAHDATNSILMFGGNEGPIVAQIPSAKYLGDTWVFEPGYGWTKVEVDDKPKRRARYAIAVDHEGNRAILHGGRFRPTDTTGDYTLYNDLWAFDFVARTWTLLDDGEASGAPPPRYYGSGAWDASTETFYVWGGNYNTSALSFDITLDLWAWHDGTWSEVQTSGDVPSVRSFLGSTHDTARNEIVIFGGQRGDFSTLASNDLYALNLDTGVWRQLHSGADGTGPTTRMHSHITYDASRDRYVLFGGHTDFGDMNDLFQFDPNSGEWSEIYIADVFNGTGFGCLGNGSEVPADFVTMDLDALERRHNGGYSIMHDNLWVIAGMHAECSDHLDDTWRYDLEANTWQELVPATAGESCLRANDDCECLCL